MLTSAQGTYGQPETHRGKRGFNQHPLSQSQLYTHAMTSTDPWNSSGVPGNWSSWEDSRSSVPQQTSGTRQRGSLQAVNVSTTHKPQTDWQDAMQSQAEPLAPPIKSAKRTEWAAKSVAPGDEW